MEKMAKVKYLGYVKPGKAKGLVKDIYNKANSEFGISADPFLLHSADEHLLEAYYTLGREVLVVQGEVSRKSKDALATIVSHQNTCQYCVDAHSISVGAEGDTALMKALSENNMAFIAQHPLHSMIDWFSGKEGQLKISEKAFAEYLSVFFYFHYTNRMINVFVENSHVPNNRWKGLYYKMGQWFLKRYTSRWIKPGIYQEEDADRTDFEWASLIDVTQGRLAHMNGLLSRNINAILAPLPLETLHKFTLGWDGNAVPMGQWWMNDVLSGYEGRARSLMRFALLMMAGHYMITASDIDEARQYLDNVSLLTLASWSAFQAAKRLSHLKYEQFKSEHAILHTSIS